MKAQIDAMTKALYGENAVHVPFNAIVQGVSTFHNITAVTLVGQSSAPTKEHPLTFGSKMTHQLVLGDIIFRPHIVVESNAFRGYGLSGLAKMAPTDWLDNPHNVILNMTGDLDKRLKR